ncbi:Phosphatidylserine/phosphatidylglycerophosphate/cardiolipin synthase [Halopseudomonas litoralis]|uniref:phospholipase D n=2 Tax=Halopseudomonas litoralis TaxID=797277 RepID=A0A1H1VU39_9GAMM|nr:Phosphatidylserine/phosphatidylglycerophosphate/cardiolipin synthase [Halopseudomonas litoralis]
MDILNRINRRKRRRRPLRVLIALLLIAWLASSLFQAYQPMSEGLSASTPWRPAGNAQVLLDQTWQTSTGERISEQQIFDEVLAMINSARRLVVLDMFLFNDFAGQSSFRSLSAEVTAALIEARKRHPNLQAVLITDPFNTLYGGLENPALLALQRAGVDVLMTPVAELPASNVLWSSLWHLCCRFVGNSNEGGWLPNPVADGKVTLRTYLHLANFRANHRKTIVADAGDSWTALVTSANPHDASSRHSNQALRFSGAAALDLLQTENVVAQLAGFNTVNWPRPPITNTIADSDNRLRVITEGAIRDAVLQMIDSAQSGDQLDMDVFYLSYRPLVEALIQAQQRGVSIRALLDPNRDAFGREKNGIPNRQAAWDLERAGIPLRWCATSGEQCHRKWIRLDRVDGSSELISGSANFTRRNLDDLNLETDVQLIAAHDFPAMTTARSAFERVWHNADGIEYSLPYAEFADHNVGRYVLYRVMEATGLSTF